VSTWLPLSIHSISTKLRTFSQCSGLALSRQHSTSVFLSRERVQIFFFYKRPEGLNPRVSACEASSSKPVEGKPSSTGVYGLRWLTVEVRSSTRYFSTEKMFPLLNQTFSRKREPRCSFSPRLERRGRPGVSGGTPAPIDHRVSHKKTTSASNSSDTSSNNSIQACSTATSTTASASLNSSHITALPRKAVGAKRAILPYLSLYYDISKANVSSFA
jgi:hypothetical protein